MGEYDRSIAVALKLIKKKGQQIQWIQKSESIIDSAKPWNPSSGVETIYTPRMAFFPFDQGPAPRGNREFLSNVGETEAFTGKFYGLMGLVNFVPNPKDVVMRDGVSLEINAIDLLSPNGQTVLWTVIFNG